MDKEMEGAIADDTVTGGMMLKSMILRRSAVLLLTFIFAFGLITVVASGGGGGGSGGSDDTDNTDNGGTSGTKTGVYEQNGGDVTESGKTYAATGTDQSAVYVYGGGTYSLTEGTLTKTAGITQVKKTAIFTIIMPLFWLKARAQ